VTAEEPSSDASDPGGPAAEGRCELTLYVSGASDLSAHAITDARAICDEYLAGRAQLRVVDVHDDSNGTLGVHVFATPTLVRESPLPLRKVVGSLSDAAAVLVALELRPARERDSR
jgi:circadian clock protein KaiB